MLSNCHSFHYNVVLGHSGTGALAGLSHLQGKEHESQHAVVSLPCFSPSLVDMVTEVPSRRLCRGLRWSPKPREVDTGIGIHFSPLDNAEV